ncbi:MAG: SusC/RagA family TonB-linked outer membrane protein, partial [Bacteroides sp.]
MNLNFRKAKAITVLAGLLFFSSVMYAQSPMARVSIPKGEITIEKAFNLIEKQSNMSIAYNISQLGENRVVTLDLSNATLDEALSKTLEGTGFTYKIDGNYIMIVAEKQQQAVKKISGTITDELDEPMIGVNIALKGKGTGTITDYEGRFNLDVREGEVLTVSYIGYESKEVRVGQQNAYNIKLIPDTQLLNEVVVTALGIKRETKALSYNVQEVKSEDLLTNKDANFINSLAGKVAGVNINSSSSGVGGASKVVMRGVKSISQSSNALYVIDGVPMYNMGKEGGTEFDSAGTTEGIADINPEDIESMSVLTGAAAAALYGSEAANGAIVITTKKGKAGYTSFTFSQNTDFLKPFVLPEFQNTYGTGSSSNATDLSWGNKLLTDNNYNFKPHKDFFKTGVVTSESLAFSTGTEKNQTYVSAGAVNSVGLIPNNDYDRYNFTFRNTTSALEDKLHLDLGGSYIKQQDMNMVNQGVYGNPLITSYLFPRGADWNDIKMYERYDPSRKIYTQYWPDYTSEFTGQNPYWIAHRNLRENKKDRYMLNAGLSYDILDWLNVSGRVRIDNSVNDFTEKYYATTNLTLAEGSSNGLYGITTTKQKQTYADFLVNINKTFDNLFSVHANLGTSYSDKRESFIQNRGPIREDGLANVFTVLQLDDNKTKRVDGGWHEQVQSIFGSVELGYKGAYYLTLTGRNDWPSQLAGKNSKNKSFFYPSIGTSVVLSEVLDMPKQINYMKVRASWASVGTPFRRYLANITHRWDDDDKIWELATDYADTFNLKPERTDSWEIGLTTKLFNHFNLDLSYYYTVTKNQTF